jgi:acetyl-CoA carboxylase carboxyl transferase subunit beta
LTTSPVATTTTATTAADAAWAVCTGCRTVLYGKRLARNLRVCPDCGQHHQLSAAERVRQLFDPHSVEFLEFPVHTEDVLGFIDTKPYPERIEQARRKTGMSEGVLVLTGRIGGHRLVAAVMDFAFLGGSLGAAAGELITRAAEEALYRELPLLIVTASGGARMQEGPIALMQMAKTSQALAEMDEAGLLTIALITDPTFGGVAASFGTQCDVIVAEPAARLGFAGRRVIEQTIGADLPPGFQTAEFLHERGLIDLICPRYGLRDTLRRLLAAASHRPAGRTARLTAVPAADTGPAPLPEVPGVVTRDYELLTEIDPWGAVQQARDLERPTTQDYIAHGFHDFVELHGDRVGGECRAILGGVAMLDEQPVVVIGHQRGRTASELTLRNFGMPNPAGYRKAARLMRLAGKLGIPIVTFVDTPGAFPGVEAEERGQAIAIAHCISLMTTLRVPVLTVIIGEGGSGGALALAVANEVYISERGVYSVISPEGCASILWNDPAMAPAAAGKLKLDARNLLRMRVVDGVIGEPDGGSQTDHGEAARRVAGVLTASLRRLTAARPEQLVQARRARFRSCGSVLHGEVAAVGQ